MRILFRTTDGPFGTETYIIKLFPEDPQECFHYVYWINQNYYERRETLNTRVELLNYARHFVQNVGIHHGRADPYEELFITWDDHGGDGSHLMN